MPDLNTLIWLPIAWLVIFGGGWLLGGRGLRG